MYLPIDMLSVFLLIVVFAISQAYVNVALNKPAYQQYSARSDDRYDASNAVDGRKSDLSMNGGQCALSVSFLTATWWVNLTSIHSIHHITIYFRTENDDYMFRMHLAGRVLGFSVYVSNTTDRSQGTLCFKDDNFTINTIPSVFTANCFNHGQYVIYYNERLPGVVYPDNYESFVGTDLCEVEVYGCDSGSYGVDCNEICGNCLNESQCSNVNGTCFTGCNAGYEGDLCKTECNRGSYGYECNETCGHCRNNSYCFPINGTCLTVCDVGYEGALCKTQCDKGSYGIGCNETCGHCRDVSQCSHINGTCLTGCETGFKGDVCKLDCDSGSYGVDCNEICGNCLNESQCSIINGTCFSGCNAGYEGDLCKTECNRGSYGYGCNETCGHCRDKSYCFPINGTCLTGCDVGYEGALCKTRE
ncbi:multiple epidermal growth factor-like domains protein 10 [Crassostrea angulata]|uniref:multiple epidermal growth factor-like domains protein 10 n=1 Tax=Magallana angulata TaxID=2784310 RepID=UPI0022B0CCE6|nr:multiple epidermal growth factor-like domains protein 10 [Crassostrea angulata]